MVALLLAALLAAPPFWEAKPPSAWTSEEIQLLLRDSPWAQEVAAPIEKGGVVVYLATARPLRAAEEELIRRNPRLRSLEDPDAEEFREFLRENAGKVIVLAVQLPRALTDDAEIRRMEKECVLKVGRRKYRVTGHFPPAPTDPHLRLVFPRDVRPEDKTLRFELYVPGLGNPYRWAEFRVRELKYKGAPEF
jgi:hypothetical protein